MGIHQIAEIENLINDTPAKDHWARIGIQPHHGLCVPLFSLRTEQSAGIGEFYDLIPMLDWCRQLGIDTLQLLPLNDTGIDTSPYSAISAYAINPLHLSLHSLSSNGLQPLLHEMQGLNHKPRVDYPKIIKLKESFLRFYFKERSADPSIQAGFSEFKDTTGWLESFALFKSLKKKFQWKSWMEWPEACKNPNPTQLANLKQEHREEIEYHSFIQYLCFQQLSLVHKEARQRGIFLKGDIPILIGKDSADVWLNQHLFHLHFNAGAPPDIYNPNGQDWGFPVYNWDELEKDNYSWWKQRLTSTHSFYDLYRLDHIVGFYRIWAVNLKTKDHPGDFIPHHPETWINHGERIMKMLLSSSHQLPIGEDLGVVPPKVRVNLRQLGICGTKVMRWERMWEEDKRFIPVNDYHPLSMTTVSTHDSETLQLWWRNQPNEAREYCEHKGWTYAEELSLEQHKEILRDSHSSSSLFHINQLHEYLALIPHLTWPDPNDERINVPGVISEKNWSYRYRPFVSEMIQNEELTAVMQNIIGK